MGSQALWICRFRNLTGGLGGPDSVPARFVVVAVALIRAFRVRIIDGFDGSLEPLPRDNFSFSALLSLLAITASPCNLFAVSRRNLVRVFRGFLVFEVTVGVFSFAI